MAESAPASASLDAGPQFPAALLEKVDQLPSDPGVYLYKSAAGAVIYVGKAKNLRSRVRSYFQALDPAQFKTAFLVRRIADLDYIVTRNEKEAFLLENTLIKKHRPRYNVRLRDDKDYISLRIDPRERWPRVEIVRRPTEKGVLLFGPYASAGAVRETLQSLQRIFPLRPCTNGKFTQYRRRGRPCLDYQLKKCSGPCGDRITPEEYQKLVDGTAAFLRGRKGELVESLQAQMADAAAGEQFEKAARFRDQIRAIEQTLTRQTVARYSGADSHVLGLAREGERVAIVVLEIVDGRLENKAEFFFPDLPEDDDVIVADFLSQYYLAGAHGDDDEIAAARVIPREVVLPLEIQGADVLGELLGEAAGRVVALVTPQRGVRAELQRMAESNAAEALRKKKEEADIADVPLQVLQEKLHLPRLPRRIECFDISNTMGTGAVGSMVVFTDGKPDRSAYRRFKIKTVHQADDFAMMGEVLRRRLRRGLDEGLLPDLLIVDGGKGQLAVAVHVAQELGIEGMGIAGLAKSRILDADPYATEISRSDERLFLPNRKNPVILARNSSALHLVTFLRDEAHRFAVSYHRLIRRKGIKSRLADVPGVGPKRQRALLRAFGSVRAMRDAGVDELAAAEGMSRTAAERVYAFLHPPHAPEEAGPLPSEAGAETLENPAESGSAEAGRPEGTARRPSR